MSDSSSDTKNINSSTCHHCGDDCGGQPIVFDQKAFCCQGCKMVFQILSENDLCNYYDIEAHPGISLKTKKGGWKEKFAWLDDANLAKKLIEFQDENQTKLSLFLPQIHCASCIWLLENLYKLRPGILGSEVNFLKREIHLSFEPKIISLREVAELLSSIGYEPKLSLDRLESSDNHDVSKRYLKQLAVAGFCAGNIMLASFPEYFGISENNFIEFFGYLNLILALPVVLYSARDYLQSAYQALKRGGLNIDVPISLGILSLFTRSTWEVLSHTGAGYFDSMAGLIFFLLVGKWFQRKTHDALKFDREFTAYFPIAVSKIGEGREEKSVALPDLEVGDKIKIRNDEIIPADAILMSKEAEIDYSFVTGESKPQNRKSGDLIYAGGRLLGSAIELDLIKKVSQSYLTRLWNHEAFDKTQKNPPSSLADRLGKWFTIIILLIAFGSGFWWLQTSAEMALMVFSSVLIVACPCALALTTPFTLGNALRILSRKGLYLRHVSVVEQMAEISQLVFDKTGTLTQQQSPDNEQLSTDVLFFRKDKRELDLQEKSLIKSLTAESSHPLSRAIFSSLNGAGTLPITEFQEIRGQGVQAKIDKHFVKLGSSEFIKTKTSDKNLNTQTSISYLEIDGKFIGRFEIQNTYRKGMQDLFQELGKDYELSLLSGDNDSERERLQSLFPPQSDIDFNQSPFSKLEKIESLQQAGKKIMMIGDGLNDAGALMKSDVGLAVSEDVNNFSPACDGILDANRLVGLADILSFAKGSVKLVKTGLIISLMYNLIGLGFAIQGLLSPVVAAILMPLSSLTIIAFAMVSTSILSKKIKNPAWLLK